MLNKNGKRTELPIKAIAYIDIRMQINARRPSHEHFVFIVSASAINTAGVLSLLGMGRT
jgi:hypothetical protein